MWADNAWWQTTKRRSNDGRRCCCSEEKKEDEESGGGSDGKCSIVLYGGGFGLFGAQHVTISIPPTRLYFDPDDIQAFARITTKEVNEVEVPKKSDVGVLKGSGQLKPKTRNHKSMKLSESISLRSGRVQRSRVVPTRKVAGRTQDDGKRRQS